MRLTLRSRFIVAVALLTAMACASNAAAAPPPPMTVSLHQPFGRPRSYFDFKAQPGQKVQAGTLELRNRRARRVTVLLDPIGAVTASTLGSAYQVRGAPIRGPARWTRLARRRVRLGPHARRSVAVTVALPSSARPGDYLSGIGVQALRRPYHRRPHHTKARSNVSISSIQRYAIGLEVQIPGPRHPLIRLTKASIHRNPAGVTFYIFGRNAGNVILKHVHGRALVSQGDRVVKRLSIRPGTFVTGTSIAFPILTPSERPQEGTVYRVRAVMRYRGRVARLNTLVGFGAADALRELAFEGTTAPSEHRGFPAWLVAIAPLAILDAVVVFLLRRQWWSGPR